MTRADFDGLGILSYNPAVDVADSLAWRSARSGGDDIVAQRVAYPDVPSGADAPPVSAPGLAHQRPGPDSTAIPNVHPELSVAARIRRDWVMLALAAPGVAYFLIFHYLPLLGYIIAFQDYQPFLGF